MVHNHPLIVPEIIKLILVHLRLLNLLIAIVRPHLTIKIVPTQIHQTIHGEKYIVDNTNRLRPSNIMHTSHNYYIENGITKIKLKCIHNRIISTNWAYNMVD